MWNGMREHQRMTVSRDAHEHARRHTRKRCACKCVIVVYVCYVVCGCLCVICVLVELSTTDANSGPLCADDIVLGGAA